MQPIKMLSVIPFLDGLLFRTTPSVFDNIFKYFTSLVWKNAPGKNYSTKPKKTKKYGVKGGLRVADGLGAEHGVQHHACQRNLGSHRDRFNLSQIRWLGFIAAVHKDHL